MYFAYFYALSITSSVCNELLLSFSVSLETKEFIWSSTLEDRMLVNELVSTSGVAIIVGMWGSESITLLSLMK